MQKRTSFRKFAETCHALQSTTRRLEKTSILSKFLLSLNRDELGVAPLFFLGKAFADHDARTLNVSWQTLQRILKRMQEAEQARPALSLQELSEIFTRIADTSGKGSRSKIDDLLAQLLSRTDSLERDYLIKIIFGEMRIGVAEGLLLEGIAKAAEVAPELVRRANMYLGDPGEVAQIALAQGEKGLAEIKLQLFKPVQPMLAELAEDIATALRQHHGKTAFEIKLDGARVQIHKKGGSIKIYSRHLTDVTASLPDLAQLIETEISANEVVLEGEVVAVSRDGRPLPFQELMRRFRRVHDIEQIQKEVPIHLYLFDLLYLNGASCIGKSYQNRWNLLSQVAPATLLVDRLISNDEKRLSVFLENALAAGHEGLMAKQLNSTYQPGSRGKRWFKIKPAETLDLVIIAADWGSGRRVGWLSNYHLAARDEKSGEFMMLGKTFKGLTDDQFRWMTQKLLSLKTSETDYTVRVKPEVVVEVAYNEIQRSPHYDSKFALRFARIKRIREDKSPDQADTMTRLRHLYEKQFERKGRAADEAKFK